MEKKVKKFYIKKKEEKKKEIKIEYKSKIKNFYIFLIKKIIKEKGKEASETRGIGIKNFIKGLEKRFSFIDDKENWMTNKIIIKKINRNIEDEKLD